MKKFYFLLLLLFPLMSSAQKGPYYPASYLRVLTSDGKDTLKNGLAGGMANPIFSNIDLNGDGLKDIFVFDRGGDCITTFLAVKGTDRLYEYHPEFEARFPNRMVNWAFLLDYNNDGKPDIFMHGLGQGFNNGLLVYKNTSTKDSITFSQEKFPVMRRDAFGSGQLDIGLVEVPVFSDVDNDGDIDIVIFEPATATIMNYYENVSVENYGRPDSLEFEYRDACFGKIIEQSNSTYDTFSCRSARVLKKKQGHSGSALQLIDLDNDGDKDILISDIGSNEVVMFTNARISGTQTVDVDSFINPVKGWPSTTRIDQISMPYISQIDVDNDGILDIVSSPIEPFVSQPYNVSWYYKNLGDHYPKGKPYYQIVEKNFLENTMLDAGSYSIPCFWDYDGDGKKDVLMSVESIYNGQPASRLMLYLIKQNGNGNPYLKLEKDNYLDLEKNGITGLAPLAVDLDKDGVTDLVMGMASGEVQYFNNIAKAGETPAFAAPVLLRYDNNGANANIQLSGYSKPAAADLNGDGYMDLIIGSSKGDLAYFEYKGVDMGSILYKMVTPAFGGHIWNDQEILLKGTAPCLTDLDKDGKPDLVLGLNGGDVRIYRDILKDTSQLVADVTPFYSLGNNIVHDIQVGYNSAPAVAEIDGDTFPDILVGSYRGGLLLYTSQNNGFGAPAVSITKEEVPEIGLMVYPNPAQGILNINYTGNRRVGKGILQMMDITGKVLLSQPISLQKGSGAHNIDVSTLPQGLYMLHISGAGGESAHVKVLVSKN